MKEGCIYILLVIIFTIFIPLFKDTISSAPSKHLSTYESLIVFQGTIDNRTSLPFYERVYYLSENQSNNYDGVDTIRLIRWNWEMPEMVGNYQSLQLREQAFHSDFFQVSNMYKFLNKVLFVPNNQNKCKGQLQHRLNGLSFCKINVTITYLIDLARTQKQITSQQFQNNQHQNTENQSQQIIQSRQQQIKQQVTESIDQHRQKKVQNEQILKQQQIQSIQQYHQQIIYKKQQQFQKDIKQQQTSIIIQQINLQTNQQLQNHNKQIISLKQQQQVSQKNNSQIILINQTDQNKKQEEMIQKQINNQSSNSNQIQQRNEEQKTVEQLGQTIHAEVNSNEHVSIQNNYQVENKQIQQYIASQSQKTQINEQTTQKSNYQKNPQQTIAHIQEQKQYKQINTSELSPEQILTDLPKQQNKAETATNEQLAYANENVINKESGQVINDEVQVKFTSNEPQISAKNEQALQQIEQIKPNIDTLLLESQNQSVSSQEILPLNQPQLLVNRDQIQQKDQINLNESQQSIINEQSNYSIDKDNQNNIAQNYTTQISQSIQQSSNINENQFKSNEGQPVKQNVADSQELHNTYNQAQSTKNQKDSRQTFSNDIINDQTDNELNKLEQTILASDQNKQKTQNFQRVQIQSEKDETLQSNKPKFRIDMASFENLEQAFKKDLPSTKQINSEQNKILQIQENTVKVSQQEVKLSQKEISNTNEIEQIDFKNKDNIKIEGDNQNHLDMNKIQVHQQQKSKETQNDILISNKGISTQKDAKLNKKILDEASKIGFKIQQ